MLDREGLLTVDSPRLNRFTRPYAQAVGPAPDLLTALETHRPTAIIGVSAQAGGFTEAVVRAMCRINPRPIIFPLSNPTSCSECTAEQAYAWSGGNAIFASGSPFAAVRLNGRQFTPGQANNAYIFPGVGLGVMLSRARRVSPAMFHVAARTLAGLVDDELLEAGRLFPPLGDIRRVSAAIAVAVAQVAWEEGLATVPRPDNLVEFVTGSRYDASYPAYR
jgi:malate dehydrogenase (oxaloacetate-decarboxylating)(NADP+)